MLTAGLPRTGSGLHRSFMPLWFFRVPPDLCKGREGMASLLQASEHPSGKETLWEDARRQHPPEQVEPPHFTGCCGEGGGTREQLLPKTWPQDVAARTMHTPVCSCLPRGSWSLMDNEIVFFNSFSRRRDQKASGVHWKFICLTF